MNETNKVYNHEDFIGWKSEDGKLEVIGIYGRIGKALGFKVTCTECSKDHELFPEGYFISTKANLKKGQKPCGCAKIPKWKSFQYLILAHRAAKGRFIVHGFAEVFKGKDTKLSLECLKDGHKWSARINNVLRGRGCPKCKYELIRNNQKLPEEIAFQNCSDICKNMGYEVIGFIDGYKNAQSYFEYVCKIHGVQKVRYNDFVNNNNRCMGCWKDKQKESGNLNGYYSERKDETDFLYVLDFDGKFIKIGRSFDVNERRKCLRTKSKININSIVKLRIFTATHQEIYDLEQELLEELRGRNFQFTVRWSNECFQNDSLFILNKLLDNCGFEELTIE